MLNKEKRYVKVYIKIYIYEQKFIKHTFDMNKYSPLTIFFWDKDIEGNGNLTCRFKERMPNFWMREAMIL